MNTHNYWPVTKKFSYIGMTDCFSSKHATKDDSFFEERYTVPNLKGLKKSINVNHENLDEADPFFDGVRELKR